MLLASRRPLVILVRFPFLLALAVSQLCAFLYLSLDTRYLMIFLLTVERYVLQGYARSNPVHFLGHHMHAISCMAGETPLKD